MHLVMNELAEKYGDIFCLQLGSRLTVIVNSREAIYETLVKKARQFAGRPDLATFNKTRHGATGISMCNFSQEYKRNRQMSVKALHKMFLDKENLEGVMQQEANKLVDLFNHFSIAQNAFNPIEEFHKVVPSVMMNIMFGKNLSYDNSELQSLICHNRKWFESAEATNPADYIKILEKFPNKRLDAIQQSGMAFYGFIFKKMLEYNNNDTCLLQSYIRLYKEDLNTSDLSDHEKFELARVLADMLGGGFDTLAAALSWSLLYLIDQPNIMLKCRQEITAFTSKKPLRIDDQRSLPYFLATIYDILRLSSIAPLGLPRCTTEDVKIRGFLIPKDTMILANLWAVNNNPNLWKETKKLCPENFLTDEGQIDSSAIRKLASFSSGVRRCPGEKFAIHEMFVLLGTLIKLYDFQLYTKPVDMLPNPGLTLQPKHYTIRISQTVQRK